MYPCDWLRLLENNLIILPLKYPKVGWVFHEALIVITKFVLALMSAAVRLWAHPEAKFLAAVVIKKITIQLSWLPSGLSSLFSTVFIMADSDSDLGFFPSLVQRIRRRNSDLAREIEDSDEESLYETMPQKMMKMNKKKRIVRKGGLTNVTYKNISKKRRRYISDLYTTLLDSSWTYVVLLFASSFYGSWILFGGISAFLGSPNS